MEKKYPRDLIGYGSKQIKVVWPNNARLAIQIVLNYEEGGENSVLLVINTQRFFYQKL